MRTVRFVCSKILRLSLFLLEYIVLISLHLLLHLLNHLELRTAAGAEGGEKSINCFFLSFLLFSSLSLSLHLSWWTAYSLRSAFYKC
jgi:hypothetical protein